MESGEPQLSGLTALPIASGNRDKQALHQLLPSVYDELRRLAVRSYMAGAYTELGGVYDTLALHPATPAAERIRHRRAALEAHRRGAAIWSDLGARGILSPGDSGRVAVAVRAVPRAEQAVR